MIRTNYRSGTTANQNNTALAYLNNKFFMLGETGGLGESSDGISWLQRSWGATSRGRCIIKAEDYYVAAGFGWIGKSKDGISWTKMNTSADTFSGLAYAHGTLFLSCDNTYNIFFTNSLDNFSWQTERNAELTTWEINNSMCYCNYFDRMVVVGKNGKIFNPCGGRPSLATIITLKL